MEKLPEEKVLYVDKKQAFVNEGEVFDLFLETQAVNKDLAVAQFSAAVEITPSKAGRPAFFVVDADAHAGSLYTRYERIKHKLEYVRRNPDFYLIIGGDTVDIFNANLGRASQGVYSNPLPPSAQIAYMQALYHDLDKEGKLLCYVTGNHERFVSAAGLSFEDSFLKDFSCPIFDGAGVLTVKYGYETYTLVIAHRFTGNSQKNPCNAAKNLMDRLCSKADASIVCHTHNKAVEAGNRGGEPRVFIVGGTEKLDDPYGLRQGYGKAVEGGASIMVWPDEHLLTPFSSLREVTKLLSLSGEAG